MKLGILGGSFNPIHNGHLAVAEAALRAHGLDRVILVVAGRPPHKGGDLAPAADRLEMARLAASGRAGLEVSDVEISRPGPSYTVETLEEMRRRHPDAELFFILGDDSLSELPTWRSPGRILELARIISVNRPTAAAPRRPEDYPSPLRDASSQLEADRVEMPPCPIEARAIREAVGAGRSIRGLVPEAVERYIQWRGLYRSA